MRGSNLGMSKAMALDTLGNAYMTLRDNSVHAWPIDSPEYIALLDAGDIIGDAMDRVKADFNLLDFTIQGGK